MFLIEVERTRDTIFRGSIFESNETTAVPVEAGDKVRIKIGRHGATPVLDLVSGTPTANGSSIAVTVASNAYTLVIAKADADLLAAGPYTAEVLFVDSSEVRTKPVDRGLVIVLPTQGGNTG